MAFSDYNESASLNTIIGGKYTGENMQRSDVDAVLRQLAADGKSLDTIVVALQALVDGLSSEAEITALLNGYYPGARSFVPRGITGINVSNKGTGAADGTDIACTFAGGNFTVNPSILFDRVGGEVVNVRVTGPGLYIGASPTAPTITFPGSGAGFAFTSTVDYLVGSGAYYWTDHATDTSLGVLFQNVSGVATQSSPLVTYPKTVTHQLVLCTPGGTANAITLTPNAGYPVSGTSQIFFFTAAGQNNGNVTVAIPGINGGVATAVKMPNGDQVQAATIKTNYLCGVRYRPSATEYELVWPSANPYPSIVFCNQTGGTGNAPVLTIANAGERFRSDFTDVVFAFQATATKSVGAASFTLNNPSGVALLTGNPLYDTDGVTSPGDQAWKSGDLVMFRRLATGVAKLLKSPDTTTQTVTYLSQAVYFDRPAKAAPVNAFKVSEREWLLRGINIAVDTPGDYRRMDFHEVQIYDMGNAMSKGVLQCTYAPAINSQRAFINGRFYEYANMSSDEQPAGTFDGIQPSIYEFAERVGLMTDGLADTFGVNDPKHNFYGLGHGLLATVSAACYLNGSTATNYIDDPIGTRLRGTEIKFDTLYDCYRPSLLAPTRIGQVRVEQTFDANGLRVKSTHKVGRALGYNTGGIQPPEGATITGATSGATATVVVVPDSGSTGTWGGGNRAGTMYVKNVVGVFVATEDLRVTGVTQCKATGAAGPQISNQNSYSMMCPTTNINRAKANGQTAITVGLEDGNDYALGASGYSRMQFWHTDETGVLFEMILQNAGVEDDAPKVPPGDYSEATTSKFFVQNRSEGIDKGYVNWRSGTSTVAYEGEYVSEQLYRFRKGAVI